MKYSILLFAILFAFVQPAAAQQRHKLTGHWKGKIYRGNTVLGNFKTQFKWQDGQYSGTFTVQGKTFPFKRIHITKGDSVLLYIVKGVNGPTHFKGSFKNDSLITGKMTQTVKSLQVSATFQFKITRFNPSQAHETANSYNHKDTTSQRNGTTATQSRAAQQIHKLAGHWKGELYQDTKLLDKFKMQFKYHNAHYSGKFLVDGYTFPLKKIDITKDDSVLIYQIRGVPTQTQWSGKFQSDSLITGKMFQNDISFTFKLKRYQPIPEKRPYYHKDIIIQENDSIQIGGTLTWPKKQKVEQLVIMTTGSGRQTRDENAFGFKIFKQIADYLTRRGIATFRYDDRGAGESTGRLANATPAMLAGDVETIVKYFSQKHRSIPTFTKIALLGHSKGGVVDGKAAAESKRVDKLILMSSPSVPLNQVLIYQISRKIKNRPFTKVQKREEIASLKKMIEAIINDKNVEKAKTNYHNLLLNDLKTLPDSIKTKMGDLKMMAKKITNVRFRILKFFKSISFLTYNPANDLKKLDIPVLATFGGKDIQVPISQNMPATIAALNSADVSYQINVFKNADHLYQKAKSKKHENYAKLPKKFVEGFLPTIAQWLKRTGTEK